jgi:hypothetical protein
MADNVNENGLPSDDISISQYQLNSPAVLDSEHQIDGNMQNIGSPAVLDSDYQVLASKAKISSAGLSVGEDAGRNVAMFV